MFILSDLTAPPLSWRSKIVGYAAKEFVFSCLLHISAKVAPGFGRLLSVLSSSVCLLVGGDLVGGLSGSKTGPVPTCSLRIASSYPADVVGVCGRCGVVGVGDPSVLNSARPCRLLMSFLSSIAFRFSNASRFTLGVAIVHTGAWGSVAAIGRVFPSPGYWLIVLRMEDILPVEGGGWFGSSWNPRQRSLYCSGTRGPSRNSGPCSLKCTDWRPLSPGLSVRDVGVGRAGGSVCSGASPLCSLSRSSELGDG